jgi:ABC-type antimicrobial peptide transport system permease subunit
MTLVVRTVSQPQEIVAAIRGQLRSLDPDLPVYKVETLQEIVWSSISQTRLSAFMLSLFACSALILAAIGVYGVLVHLVAQSRHEIGVRTALGARQSQILRLFLGQGLKWAAIGGSSGFLAALMLARLMRSILFEVGPYDPSVFLTAAAVLTAVVLFACYVPAFRAAKVDPMLALRSE